MNKSPGLVSQAETECGGVGHGLTQKEKQGLCLKSTGAGVFQAGEGGVQNIYATPCCKLEFIEFEATTLGYVPSALGYPAFYQVDPIEYSGRAKAVLMDLDGTSVHSEEFWMYIIQRTMQDLMNDPGFCVSEEDIPFVSGHSVSEHLEYCIKKYSPGESLEHAREIYHRVTAFEMDEIMKGRGKVDAFSPAPYLKEFLTALKQNGVKIALVTSGLYYKAMPEIVSAFRVLGMGDPVDFYDTIITAGQIVTKGKSGTLGELVLKPHPWLYAEAARIGLGIAPQDRSQVIGLEDSAAGIYALRLAGFASIGIAGGNIKQSGVECLCRYTSPGLQKALEIILG